MSFADLGLSKITLAALARAGLEAPTPIQAQAIPPALLGKDVIGCAATGTGKTAAFALPLIERLEGKKGTRALILAPTRELALQIHEQIERFAHGRALRSAVVIGGVGMNPQIEAFRRGTEVIVATPGRLNDHLDSRTAKLNEVEILVLDEADRMLDMGFLPQLERILKHVPRKRQSLLFSATMAGEVARFAAQNLVDPVRIEVARSGTTAERAHQQVYFVGQEEKTSLLLDLLDQDELSTLVFTRTKRRADRLMKALVKGGHAVAVIHADRSQGQRRAALESFKAGDARVLVATDIAARGIDVADIGHVVNFDLPNVPDDYVHRIGRTARMAASGRASSFASPDEHVLLRDIEAFTKKRVERAARPGQDRPDEMPADEPRAPQGGGRRPPGSGGGRGGGGGGGGRRGGAGGGGRSGGGGGRSSGGRSAGGGSRSSSSAEAPARSGPPQKLGSWKPKRRR